MLSYTNHTTPYFFKNSLLNCHLYIRLSNCPIIPYAFISPFHAACFACPFLLDVITPMFVKITNYKYTGKGKVVPVNAMKTNGREEV
jgi:hypothetical protein